MSSFLFIFLANDLDMHKKNQIPFFFAIRIRTLFVCHQHISDHVRTEYSGLWLSILGKDMDGMKKHGEALGVGNLCYLFACMVAGRSWPAIQRGITTTDYDQEEVSVLKLCILFIYDLMTSIGIN